ncbi:MAG TPA: PAS domain S-box protein, partial [Anaerolineales bacterium]|nr:PAS domain S-box protein [Anaerolineales bacterium]
ILAPLLVDDETLGLLKINGTFLNQSDIPAMEVFAAQIATGLSNIRLVQKLQDELYARQKAEESLHRSRKTLLALGQAAQSIQKTHTPEDIYRVVGEQIKALGLEATILTLNSNRQTLCHSYTTLSTDIIQNAEKMAKVSAQGYCWQIDPNGTYNRIIFSGKSEFIHKSEDLFAEALPKFMWPMTKALMKILKIGQGIIAPLRVDEEDLGLLVVFGNEAISEEDCPAIDSFAGQVAISLRNAHLAKKVEAEFLEKKQAEEAVRRAKEHFEALIEKAPDGITLLGMDGKVKYASPSAKRLFDYSEEDITNLTPMEFIHPEDLDLVLETMNKLVQNPAYTPTIQYRYMRKDGVYHWVESTFSNLLTDPNVEAVVINFHDITQRKLVEKALFESEKYYRALIENASDGILVVNEEGKISYESPSVTRMLGYEPYSLLGTNAFELIHPDDMATIIEAFTQGSNTPNFVHRGEYRLIRKNGEWGYFEIVSHYLLTDPAIKG